MAASMVASAATGAALEILFENFIRLVLGVRRDNAMFAPTLDMLIETLENVKPSINKIESFNRDMDRLEEINGLKKLITKGEDLVQKCSKIPRLNIVKKPYYTKKLREFDETLRRYISTVLPVHNAAAIRETLFELRMLGNKLTNLGMGKSSFGGSIGTSSFGGSWGSNRVGTMGVCSPPGLKVVPVGLEIPLRDLKEKLLKSDEVAKVIVVSAPGGCGKTILAIALCQDDNVKDNFKCNLFFLTVSKSPNLLVIVQRLFQHFDHMATDFLSEEDAVNQLENLFKSLVPAPILLVLDDVWDGAEHLVEKLKFPIKNYKILVTSRFEFPRFGSSYKLQTLEDADAMTLFCNQAFVPDGNSYKPDQEDLNKLVKVCKGFPLAISLVGKSLCSKPAAEWNKRIKELSKASFVLENFELLNCLKSSVEALNDNAAAKECYMDLGSFPEDQKIPATTLTDMWTEAHNLDDDDAVANLHELAARNLVDLVTARKDATEDYGSVNVVQHDLLRELAIIQSNTGNIEQRKRLFIEISGNKIPEWMEQRQLFVRAKLLSICTDEMFSSIWSSMEAPEVEILILNFQTKNYTLPFFMEAMHKLKVLVVSNYGFHLADLSNFQLIGSLVNLKRIRIEHVSLPSDFFSYVQLQKLEKLSLVKCNIGQAFGNSIICMPNIKEINIDYCNDLVELPAGFCELVDLKRLSITNCHKLSALPDEIGKLVNLEMLRLNSCIDLLELPESIIELCNLRILDVSDCMSITKFPEQIGKLRNLRKLYMIDCSSCELPESVVMLANLREVIGDEETANSWKILKDLLPNVEIKIHKDVNLNWLP